MVKIKLCGLKRDEDIKYANELLPDYIGFVFAGGSKRYVTHEQAAKLSKMLDKRIVPVGVFVDEEPETIVALLESGIIRALQLHGKEDGVYIDKLRERTHCTIIQAFQIKEETDVIPANESTADYVLLDSGGGSGEAFDWSLLSQIKRPYFLAGGLTPQNVESALEQLHPYGVDVSSSLETAGCKDKNKMAAFVKAVRGFNNRKDDDNE